jgi:uncharacterized protein (TIGR03118 family)
MDKQRRIAIAAHTSKLIAAVAIGGLLAGCSGGGDDGGYGAPPPPTAPTLSLTVAPTTIGLGQSATLTWSSSPGTSCEASGGWSGTRQPSDSAEVVPTATGPVIYTLTCSGAGFSGSAARSVTLNVEPQSVYTVTSLVEDFAGGAARTNDALLVNPWGLAFGPTSATWVMNNGSDTATVYDGNGRPSPLVVHFAPSNAGTSFGATGIVFNGSADFVLDRAGQTAAALFVFAGEGGMIAGWSPGVGVADAITMYTTADGAVYKGLTLASNSDGNKFLYATDFANAKIDVFDAAFAKQTPTATSFAFTDPTLPAGYAPFGIQAIVDRGATRIYVSYAMRNGAEPNEEAVGAGLGLVDVFDANGTFVKRLVDAGGKLDAPWGMALAPADFGTLSNALLVGNFGDGAIHGYDPASGRYLGAVGDGSGTPFAAPGLWGITFGNDAVNQPHATLFFAAGINGETNGRYARIDLGAAAPALGDYPQLTINVPQGDLSGTVTVTANAQNLVAIAKVQFLVNGTPIGTATSEPFSVEWDTETVENGSARVRAVATDANGNVGSSGLLTVSVANAAAPAATLTQIQQTVFSPRCAGCHDGSQPPGGALPGSMDLRAGSSFASLVSVPSLERPMLARVAPGEPDSSYVIHKLEGAADISGARMPFGGPFLDAATIDEVRSWIAAGAPNN